MQQAKKPTQRPLNFSTQNYINRSNVTIYQNGPGRPPSDECMDAEIKARVSDKDLEAVMSFCRGRRINRSEYLRHLISLDTEWFDHIHLLNDPEVKELIFHVLKVAKKNLGCLWHTCGKRVDFAWN